LERAVTAAFAPPAGNRPLLVTADEQLLDDLVRLAALAGIETTVVADLGAARPLWLAATAVVVGGDLVAAAAAASLPRRERVVVVARADDEELWRSAVTLAPARVGSMPAAEEWLIDLFADAADRLHGPAADGLVVGVIGGRGGAGASTLACALAVTGDRAGRRTTLVDADPLGGGIDLLLGGEDTGGLRWPELTGASGRVDGAALREALPRVGELAVLSWDRGDALAIPPAAMTAVLDAAARASDLVVVDLPRHDDPAAEVVLPRLDATLLVVPAEVRATAAAARVCARVTGRCRDLQLVVRGPSPAGLDGAGVAQVLGLPLAGELRPEPGLAQALEVGEPPGRRRRGPLADFCARLLRGLDEAGRAA
jgi:secretion/DNA translocation related CpaE-like protein